MAGRQEADYNTLRLKRLLSLLDAALGSVQQLGPHSSAVEAPAWLKDFVLELLREIETNLPDPDYFKGLIPGGQDEAGPSSLVANTTNCWEVGLLLNMARNPIASLIGQDKPAAGFTTELRG